MVVGDIASIIKAFAAGIALTDPAIRMCVGEITEDSGPFNLYFRTNSLVNAGVYWFLLPSGQVIYIGKADADTWGRVCAHARGPVWGGDPAAEYRNTVGPGWTFPSSSYLNVAGIESATAKAVLSGEFRVGWVSVEPSFCAKLLEVYLQTRCQFVDRKLPALCTNIG